MTILCSVRTCCRPEVSRGMCGMHYQRLTKGKLPFDRPPQLLTKRHVMSTGYVRVWEPQHPLAMVDGYVVEHRKVVHDAGIEVPAGYHVHHINHDRADNRLENLEVLFGKEHHRHHVSEGVSNGTGTWPTHQTRESRLAAFIARVGHGDRRTYGAGCRCEPCRQSNRDYLNEWNARQRGAAPWRASSGVR